MPTINLQVSATADDAWERDTGAEFTSTSDNIYMVKGASGTRAGGGFRLQNVTLPRGSTITTAYLEMYVYSTSYDDASFTIYANKVTDAQDFSDDPDIWSRATTTASVLILEYSVQIGWFGSDYEIKTIIQEITDQPSWEYNSSLALLCLGTAGGTKALLVRAQDYSDGSLAAKLYVEYTPPVPNTPTNSSPLDRVTGQDQSITLSSSTFSHNDPTATHLASQWQIANKPLVIEESLPVIDSGTDTSNLESYSLSDLSWATNYYWRVRYQDDQGFWSDWSTETSFWVYQKGSINTLASMIKAIDTTPIRRTECERCAWPLNEHPEKGLHCILCGWTEYPYYRKSICDARD